MLWRKLAKVLYLGSIYRARKPVYWSASSQSALAEAELEYDPDHVSQCAFISYPIAVLPEELSRIPEINEGNLGALIWTTTPWTLPANRAIAVNSEMEYSVVALERSPR
jgi:isoleucyl-tRNA synthetase